MNYFNIDFDTIASKDGLKIKKNFSASDCQLNNLV